MTHQSFVAEIECWEEDGSQAWWTVCQALKKRDESISLMLAKLSKRLDGIEARLLPLENNDDARQLQELRSSLDNLHYLNGRMACAGRNPDPD